MIFITDELGNIEKNILELVENVGFKDCKTIEAIDLFCGMSEKNDVLKVKDLYYAFIEIPQYWSIRADGVNGAIYDNKTKMANIYFKNPIEKRMVSRVEWIDRNNTVYRIDYYNKYGYKYCSENVNGGNATVREFYDRNGDINVIEQTGSKTYELVLSGASMGTFGSLYYGSKLSPHALLLAKPLANMGNVARNERILRAGGFATSLDILMKNYDNLSDEAIEQLNNRMWDRFDSADWSQTKFIISYLYEDDYDPDGYPSILSHLKSSGVEVYGKGSHGRHTDNSSNVMAWFKSQYNNLLHDDFSR